MESIGVNVNEYAYNTEILRQDADEDLGMKINLLKASCLLFSIFYGEGKMVLDQGS